MFVPRKAALRKPQKQRRVQHGFVRVWRSSSLIRWVRLVALGPGFMATGTLSRLFVWAKKACLSYKLLRRFWFNLQNAAILTRKPANVRMGKGKGGRQGTRARVSAGAVVVAFSAIRPGLLISLQRRYQVRCQFRLMRVIPNLNSESHELASFWGFLPLGGVRIRGIQRGYISRQFWEFRDRLKKLRRPHLTGYFLRIFWWRHIVPYAIWAPHRSDRRRFRIRRRTLERRRFLLWLKPQGTGFLRQLRAQIQTYRANLRNINLGSWRRRRVRWAWALWSAHAWEQTPGLPWDRLLRVRRLRRALPHITYLAACRGQSFRVSGLSGLAARLSLINETSVSLRWLGGLIQAQLLCLGLLHTWSVVVSQPLVFKWLRGKW